MRKVALPGAPPSRRLAVRHPAALDPRRQDAAVPGRECRRSELRYEP